jgi:DNA adenine methylase
MEPTLDTGAASAKPAIPFLKWAGGKRWITPHIKIPTFAGRYFEPFVGSAAVYFQLKPPRAVLADLNAELIETYRTVRDRPDEVASALAEHQARHSREHYYSIRSQTTENALDAAVRFIYLNRTCWNGLYRVNQKGVFNVPIGTKQIVSMESDDWCAVSQLLNGAQILTSDFEKTIDLAQAGDFIFADPPYTVKHNLNGFIKYNEKIFSWEDQLRLKDALLRAASRGALVMATNADHQSIRDLYARDFEVRPLERASVLSGKAEFRGRYTELLIQLKNDE